MQTIDDVANLRLLLVDDEADFRRTLVKRLKKRGITPREAGSGEEVLSVLEASPADVVVLDVKMPGMNGLETLRRIKKAYPRIEVIMLTGHATTQDGVEGIKQGAFDYLSKPIELDHLLGKIKQAHEKILREEDKRREAEFRSRMEQQMIATERLASLGTLAAGVAHEINNPLAIIKESAGWMGAILKKEALADMPRKADFRLALDKIEKGVERARRITHQLLGTVKQTDSVAVEVDVQELVNEAVDLIRKEADQKGVEIVEAVDLSLAKIWSDPYKLRQVLINLLTNAVHATPAGGKVSVGAEPVVEGVRIQIADTGQGIPKENLEKIFEPFFSTKPPGEGTGLGLFVSRSIVEKLGGRITVNSQLGKGSCFMVSIPKISKLGDATES
ncbi:MAG: response regulator [Deltaproteobacteria bacterium]